MSYNTQFPKIIFENEPSTKTPLSANNLNTIQTNINNALRGVFGSDSVESYSNANYALLDGIFFIKTNSSTYPFSILPGGNYGLLIVFTKPQTEDGDGSRIIQVAIDVQRNNIWIRAGNYSATTDSADFSAWNLLNNSIAIASNDIGKTKIRIGNKDVYVKRIPISALPNARTLTIPIGITESVTPYKLEGLASYTNGVVLPLPFVSPATVTNQVSLSYNNSSKTIDVSTGSDRSSASGWVDFYFTYD